MPCYMWPSLCSLARDDVVLGAQSVTSRKGPGCSVNCALSIRLAVDFVPRELLFAFSLEMFGTKSYRKLNGYTLEDGKSSKLSTSCWRWAREIRPVVVGLVSSYLLDSLLSERWCWCFPLSETYSYEAGCSGWKNPHLWNHWFMGFLQKLPTLMQLHGGVQFLWKDVGLWLLPISRPTPISCE